MHDINGKQVSWQIFIWAIGIILIAFGFIFNGLAVLSGNEENSRKDMTEIKGDIREIKTNVAWIIKAMENTKLEQVKVK